MTIKVKDNGNSVAMGLNNIAQEPGEIDKNEVHNDQHATVPAKIHFVSVSQYDH